MANRHERRREAARARKEAPKWPPGDPRSTRGGAIVRQRFLDLASGAYKGMVDHDGKTIWEVIGLNRADYDEKTCAEIDAVDRELDKMIASQG